MPDAIPPQPSGDPTWAEVRDGVVVNTLVASPEFIATLAETGVEYVQLDVQGVDHFVVPGVAVNPNGPRSRGVASRFIPPAPPNPLTGYDTPEDFISTIDYHTLGTADPEFDAELERMIQEIEVDGEPPTGN